MKSKNKDYFTVKQMIEELSKLPGDMFVGRADHFGDFMPIYKDSIVTSLVFLPGVVKSHKNMMRICEIQMPNIGEDPD